MTADAPRAGGRRERARAATIDEIKQTALDLMHGSGTTDVRFSDIARAMDMTAPALYRYFADRDALVTAIIVDAYEDLTAELTRRRDDAGTADPDGALRAVLTALREWALADPQRFALVLGPPTTGAPAVDAPEVGEGARGAMDVLESTLVDVSDLGAKARQRAALQAWVTVHGFICLEVFGRLAWLAPKAREKLFRAQVDLAVEAARATA
jgi:AcrR family transcriptional regulator